MTMHLVRGMSSLNTHKRKQQGLTQRDRQAQVEHDAWLRSQGLHPTQIKAKLPHDAKGRRLGVGSMPSYKSDTVTAELSNSVGNGFARHENTYTGDEIVGIGVMHKSNAVPIRKDSNAAEEIARMRR
jgi:hypothetical protein